MNENHAQSRSDRHQCLFPNNHGHKHLTFPFVGGSWMYILLMTSQKREKLLLFLTNCCFTLCARPNSGFAWKRSRKKPLHVDQIQDGVPTDLVTKLDFWKASSPSLLTGKTIIVPQTFFALIL